MTRDVPQGQTIVGIPAKTIKQNSRDTQFEAYGVNNLPVEDAQSRTVAALFAELETLRMRLNALSGGEAQVKAPASEELAEQGKEDTASK